VRERESWSYKVQDKYTTALTSFKIEGEVTSLSESSQEIVEEIEVGRNLGEVNGDQSKHSFATPIKL
jgi:uncharacterized membrane protein